jgi:hypothetical protein
VEIEAYVGRFPELAEDAAGLLDLMRAKAIVEGSRFDRETGRGLARYQLKSLYAKGGSGEVWVAWDAAKWRSRSCARSMAGPWSTC